MSIRRKVIAAGDSSPGRTFVTAAWLLATPLLTLAAVSAPSSIGGSYELDAQVIAAGGAPLNGANGLSSDVTVGQDNAATLSGADGYVALTGFWAVAARGGASDRIFQASFDPSGP